MDASIDLISDNDEEYADDTFPYHVNYNSSINNTLPEESHKKRRNYFFSTPEESINFMRVFKKYEVLYGKKTDPSKSVRDHAWMCISDELGIPVNALKARWRCIKDTHTKVKKKKVSTGWYMMTHLKFLDDDKPNIDGETYEYDQTQLLYDDKVNINQYLENSLNNHESDDTSITEPLLSQPKRAKTIIKAINTLRPKQDVQQIKSSPIPKSSNNQNNLNRPPPLRLINPKDEQANEYLSDEKEKYSSPVLQDEDEEQDTDPLTLDQSYLENNKLDYFVSLSEEEAAYGYHISTQLKQFPMFQREILRHKINNLIYQAFMNLKN